ncbi:MAG: hypothetical protein E6K96_01250 [Thaumarchaeota archaeon]|nr:MAG: hypothetical protein E6K96_01250 [Nitrososphaerota archaeon]
MRVASSLEGLTAESEPWFAALRADEEGDLVGAVVLYLKDAAGSVEEGAFARAGLCCSCAADCLVKLGYAGEARSLYHEAATVYRDVFESAIGTSLREALWSLERAYECFLLSGEAAEARLIRDMYKPLARRVDPFIQENLLQPPRRSPPASTHPTTGSQGGQGDAELQRAIRSFLSSQPSRPRPKPAAESDRSTAGSSLIDEEYIIKQLG